MTTTPIWREVTSYVEHRNRGFEKNRQVGGWLWMTLAGCGHEATRKLSAGYPVHVRCRRCEDLRAGMVSESGFPGEARTRETWDAERQLPRRESIAP